MSLEDAQEKLENWKQDCSFSHRIHHRGGSASDVCQVIL
jgi:hypothetical protein